MRGFRTVHGLQTVAMVVAIAALARPSPAHPGPHHDVERLTKQLKEKPDDVELLIQRAHYCRLDRQFDSALGDLTRAGLLAVSRPDIPFHIGMVYLDMDRPTDAEKELSIAIRDGLKTSQGYAARARARKAVGNLAGAVDDFTVAIAMEADVELFMERGALQVQLGRLSDAAAGYREGLGRVGRALVLSQALIDVEIRSGHYGEALRLVDEQLQQSRLKVDWLLLRAEILAKSGRAEEAMAVREEALADVNRALARRQIGVHLVSRARVNLAMGRIAEARSDVVLALNKSPKYPAALELLAKIDTVQATCSTETAKQDSAR